MQRFVNEGANGSLVWEVWVEGEDVHQRSGKLGGKLKHTWDRPGSAGRKGTKAFKPADVRALERANKKIQDKVRKGYREVNLDTNEVIEKASRQMDFHEIQRNFRFGKPLGRQPDADKATAKLVANGEPIFTIKRDGLCHFMLVTPDKDVRLYTRRLDECTASYPWLVHDMLQMGFPPRTIAAFELVCINQKTQRDDRKMAQSLSRSLAERAVRLQQDPFHRPIAVFLGFPFWDGDPLMQTQIVEDWMGHTFNIVHTRSKELRYVQNMDVIHGTFDQAKEYAITNGHEGLVVYDAGACFGDRAFNFRGRVERTHCYKWKPIYEADCLMIFDPDDSLKSGYQHRGSWGKGRLKKLPGQFALYQYDSRGMLHYLCNVGTGFTDEDREDAMNQALENGACAGVGIIKYVSRTFKAAGDDTNAMSEPVFLGWHSDKISPEAKDSRLG